MVKAISRKPIRASFWASKFCIWDPLWICNARTGKSIAARISSDWFEIGTPNLLSFLLTSNISGEPACTWGLIRMPKTHVASAGKRSNSAIVFTLTSIPVSYATSAISRRVLTGESKTIWSTVQPASFALLTSSIEAASNPYPQETSVRSNSICGLVLMAMLCCIPGIASLKCANRAFNRGRCATIAAVSSALNCGNSDFNAWSIEDLLFTKHFFSKGLDDAYQAVIISEIDSIFL